MIKLIKKSIFVICAVVILIYLATCDMIMTISLSMNLCFIVSAVLLILLQITINKPINSEEDEPSFFYTFIRVSSTLFFSAIIFLIIFNVLYPKNSLEDDNKKEYDYIIVFGAGISEGKNTIMNSRLDVAIEYAKKYRRCKFVLTGAKGNAEPIEEAIYMSNYMVERGVNDNRLIIDPYSVNTNENLRNSLSLIRKDVMKRNFKENIITRPFKSSDDKFDLDFLNIGFMSSEFHLTRINLMAKKYGIFKPYDISCETDMLYKPYLYVREDLSLFKAFVLNEIKF